MGVCYLVGGGDGSRTRVREYSTFGSTCLARSIKFNYLLPERQERQITIP